MIYEPPLLIDSARGDATGLLIPTHAEALRAAGCDFLTKAFHAYGTLSGANSIIRVTRFEPCLSGSTGQKVLLSVEYAYPESGLPVDFFVKFSRDFRDAFRDRRRGELASEIALCELSRLKDFPIRVPAPYFADFHRPSDTGLLITELIPFGVNGIEPLRPKCMDHLLDRPLDYYRAIVTALARLAAAHKSGLLSPQAEALFPFDPEAAAAADPIPWDEAGLREQIARYAAFAVRCPQLLPAHVRTADFIARFEQEALLILRHERAIKTVMHADPDYIALSHFNANIDNAWFWRDAEGRLQCGLFDWQRARPMNVAYALWGGLCGASLDIWDHHLEELLALFARQVREHGGPQLDIAELELCLHMYAATMVIAGLITMPALVLSYLPEAANASGPLDPLLLKSEPARSFLHVVTALLNQWQRPEFSANLQQVLARIGD
jgi:hypothetical protein